MRTNNRCLSYRFQSQLLFNFSLVSLSVYFWGSAAAQLSSASSEKQRKSLTLLFVLVCECVESRERGSIGTCRNWRFSFETMVGKKLKALVQCGSHAGAALKEHTHTHTHIHTYTLLLIEFSPFFHRAEDDADDFSSSLRLSKQKRAEESPAAGEFCWV